MYKDIKMRLNWQGNEVLGSKPKFIQWKLQLTFTSLSFIASPHWLQCVQIYLKYSQETHGLHGSSWKLQKIHFQGWSGLANKRAPLLNMSLTNSYTCMNNESQNPIKMAVINRTEVQGAIDQSKIFPILQGQQQEICKDRQSYEFSPIEVNGTKVMPGILLHKKGTWSGI